MIIILFCRHIFFFEFALKFDKLTINTNLVQLSFTAVRTWPSGKTLDYRPRDCTFSPSFTQLYLLKEDIYWFFLHKYDNPLQCTTLGTRTWFVMSVVALQATITNKLYARRRTGMSECLVKLTHPHHSRKFITTQVSRMFRFDSISTQNWLYHAGHHHYYHRRQPQYFLPLHSIYNAEQQSNVTGDNP